MEPTKSALQLAFEDINMAGVRSYSGRGMFGKTCLGVEIAVPRDLGLLISRIFDCADTQVGAENREEISESLKNMCWDQMGLGMIYYWPDVPFIGDGDEVDNEGSESEDDIEVE